MKPFRSFLAALAACMVLFSPLFTMAADVNDGNTPSNAKPVAGEQGAIWDGTSHRVIRGDANGSAWVMEKFPREYQRTNTVLYNSTIAASSSESIAPQIWSDASLYGMKWVRVRVDNHTIGAAGVNGPLVIRPRVSMDGQTYSMVFMQSASADSVKLDTLQYKFWSNWSGNGANGQWVALVNPSNGQTLAFPYIQFGVINRGSATDSVLIEVMGRQF